jgi:hypothetical protein
LDALLFQLATHHFFPSLLHPQVPSLFFQWIRVEVATESDADGLVENQMDNSEAKNEGKESQTTNLESNPKHILEDSAASKVSKG